MRESRKDTMGSRHRQVSYAVSVYHGPARGWAEGAPLSRLRAVKQKEDGGPPAGERPDRQSGPGPTRRDAAVAASLVVVLTLSIQTGSALAVKVIGSVGVFEALWLRTAIAALLLLVIRPSALRRLPPRGHRLPLAALAATLFFMNLSFYGAISRVPVGIVVAIEFVGPLAVAVLGTRSRLDWLWIVLAGAGVVLLAGPSGAATGLGLLLALSAGTCWGSTCCSQSAP